MNFAEVESLIAELRAKIGGFPGQKEYFKAEAGAKALPKVSFTK